MSYRLANLGKRLRVRAVRAAGRLLDPAPLLKRFYHRTGYMIELVPYIIVAKALVFALGGLITHLAYRAFRRTGTTELRWFATGVGIITLGALIGGVLNQTVGVSFATGVVVESSLPATGFAVLANALYARGGATNK